MLEIRDEERVIRSSGQPLSSQEFDSQLLSQLPGFVTNIPIDTVSALIENWAWFARIDVGDLHFDFELRELDDRAQPPTSTPMINP